MAVAIHSKADITTVDHMLKNLALFKNIDAGLLAEFSAAGQRINAAKGKILFLQDDPADCFYIIMSGWIKLFRQTVEGDEAVLDVLSTNQIFGETAIFENDTHSFGAMIAEDASLIRLPNALLKRAIEENNKMSLAMLTSLSALRRRQSREIEGMALQNASQRIGCFMLRLLTANANSPVHVTLPYDKSLIAAKLGMKSETFSRGLNRLRKETDIQIKGNAVSIPDIDNLSHYACAACSDEYPCSDLC